MQNLSISDAVLAKLGEKHGVSRLEVEQAFSNREGRLLEDKRAHAKTVPPTLWFIARTNKGRVLKVVYIQRGMSVTLKSAFEPNRDEMSIYRRYAC